MKHIANFLFLFSLLFWQVNSVVSYATASKVLGDGMNDFDVELAAQKIYHVQKSMSDKYEVGDGIGLALYILKIFSDMGNYELVQKDVKEIMKIVETVADVEYPPEVRILLEQIEKIRFGEFEGMKSVVLFGVDGKDIVIPIHEKGDGNSSINEIVEVKIRNKTRLRFNEVATTQNKKELGEFLKEVIKIPLLPKGWFGALNQIDPNILKAYKYHQTRSDIFPLEFILDGVSVLVDTSTVLKKADLKGVKGYFIPGISLNDSRVPAFVVEVKSKVIKLRISLNI